MGRAIQRRVVIIRRTAKKPRTIRIRRQVVRTSKKKKK